jgi:hypothetical protein
VPLKPTAAEIDANIKDAFIFLSVNFLERGSRNATWEEDTEWELA